MAAKFLAPVPTGGAETGGAETGGAETGGADAPAADDDAPTGAVKIFLGGGGGGDDGAELAANKAVTQRFINATDDEKDKYMYDFLCELKEGSRVVAFANTKRRAETLAKTFGNHGFGTCAVHGDKPQREREAALAKFAKDECPLMFATDVAARGLDIKGVTHVVNFDMASDVESYVHRIENRSRGGVGRGGDVLESGLRQGVRAGAVQNRQGRGAGGAGVVGQVREEQGEQTVEVGGRAEAPLKTRTPWCVRPTAFEGTES